MRKPASHAESKFGSRAAWALALSLTAGMIWMAVTGNKLCCDANSLLNRLRVYIFEKR